MPTHTTVILITILQNTLTCMHWKVTRNLITRKKARGKRPMKAVIHFNWGISHNKVTESRIQPSIPFNYINKSQGTCFLIFYILVLYEDWMEELRLPFFHVEDKYCKSKKLLLKLHLILFKKISLNYISLL